MARIHSYDNITVFKYDRNGQRYIQPVMKNDEAGIYYIITTHDGIKYKLDEKEFLNGNPNFNKIEEKLRNEKQFNNKFNEWIEKE